MRTLQEVLQSALTIAEDYRDNRHINGAATREELLETIDELKELLCQEGEMNDDRTTDRRTG